MVVMLGSGSGPTGKHAGSSPPVTLADCSVSKPSGARVYMLSRHDVGRW